MHLALNKRIDLVTACFLLPHKAQGIPVRLQRTGRTKAILPLPQKPVEESIQNIDRDVFEGGHRVLLGELAVSGSAGQTPNDPLHEQGKSTDWYQNFLTRLNMFSLPLP